VALEGKISEAKTKKDMYKSRAKAAKANQELQQQLGNAGNSSAWSAFERMEEKVTELEATSEAAGELGSSDLEQQFAQLEGGSDVDEELSAMKAQLSGSSSKGELPEGQQQAEEGEGSSQGKASDEVVDAELDELRSQLNRNS